MFCEKLVILVKGKAVLEGDLKEIKKDYRRKTIHIVGDINKDELLNIEGVSNVFENADEITVSVLEDKYISKVFDVVKKGQNITKFAVEDPSLNEIFLSKVGESYEG